MTSGKQHMIFYTRRARDRDVYRYIQMCIYIYLYLCHHHLSICYLSIIFLSFHPSIHPSVHPHTYHISSSVNLSINLCVIYLPTCLSIIYLSVIYVCLFIIIYQSIIYLSMYISTHPPIIYHHLSTCQSICYVSVYLAINHLSVIYLSIYQSSLYPFREEKERIKYPMLF